MWLKNLVNYGKNMVVFIIRGFGIPGLKNGVTDYDVIKPS